MAISYGCTVKVLAGTASERLAPLGVMTWITFASSGASVAIAILTSSWVPAALTVGALSMNIPVAGVAVIAVVPWKFWPRMVMVNICPRLARIGLIESRFGAPTPMRKVFAIGVANGTVVVPRNIWTPRRLAAAPAWTVMGTDIWVPSGAIVKAPRVILSGGMIETLVTSFRATPEIVSVPAVLGETGVVETPVATAPTATPNCNDSANVGGAAGGLGSCRTTPRAAAATGPTTCGGGGVPSCSTTPSATDVTGVMVEPAALVIVIVVCGVKVSEEVPAGVVTVTARAPVAAFAVALTVTVICVPLASTVGGLLMLIPLGGDTPTALAFWKLSPRTVSITAGASVCRKFGVTDWSTARGALTRNCAATGLAKGTSAAPAFTLAPRIV